MYRRFTQSEKKKIVVAAVLLIVIIITLFVDFSAEVIATAYVLGIVALVVAFEIYVYFMYISVRFRSFSHATLYIRGVTGSNKTYIDIDRKFTYRYPGECNGAAIKFTSGIHNITVRNETASTSIEINFTDTLVINIYIGNSDINIETEYKEQIGTDEEIKARQKSYNRVNLFIFIILNVIMFFAVLRILGVAGIISISDILGV